MSFNVLDNASLISCYLVFENGVRGQILSFDANKNLLVFCDHIMNSTEGRPMLVAFEELGPAIDDWFHNSFKQNERYIYFENTPFYLSNLREGECYDEVQIENNNEIEYLSKVGAISYKQAIALGARRGLKPPEEHLYNLFSNIGALGSWTSTALSRHHPIHLTQSYVLQRQGMIAGDDHFNGHKVSPLVCVSKDLLYSGGIGSVDDPIKILKKKNITL